MNEIVYMVTKSVSARIFVIVALSLAMAILIGGGFHPTQADKVENGVIKVVSAPSAPTGTTVTTDTSATTRSGSFDRALRDMAIQQRNQAAASSQSNAATSAPTNVNVNPAAAAGAVAQPVNPNADPVKK